MTGASAIVNALRAALGGDPTLVVLGADVGVGGGPFGMTAGLLADLGPDRIVELPAADRAVAGVALGMALAGRRVVVVLDGAGRLGAVVEVLRSAVAFSAASGIGYTVIAPYGTEAGALDAPVGLVTRIPGLTVNCAASAGQLGPLVRAAISANRPTVLLAPRSALIGQESAHTSHSASILQSGQHVTLAAWGGGVADAVAAATALGADGISAEVVDLVTLAPIDVDTLGESVRRTGRLVVVHPSDAALALDPAQIGLDQAFLYLESPIRFAVGAVAAEAAARQSVAW